MLDGVFRLFLWIYEGIADGYSHPLSHQLGEIGIECMMRESAEVILTPLAQNNAEGFGYGLRIITECLIEIPVPE